jgi:TIR domain
VARRVKRVFISYSSEDKGAAEAVCGALEAAGMRCYLAHRDNRGGMLWDEAILDALDSAAAVALVLSASANASPYVKREIERAASRDTPIAPLRIKDVQPGRSLEFFIKIHHWLDAFPGPIELYLPTLVASVEGLVKAKPANARAQSNVNVYPYMVSRGPAAHQAFTQGPGGNWDTSIRGAETIENLRAKLLAAPAKLRQRVDIKVQGTLFPCALLSSGWWERRKESKIRHLQWRDGLQEWLFHGFDLWGPSWDFTWDFDNWDPNQTRPYYIAQIGDGDEANSIPVLLPAEKAKRLTERLGRWGGIEAQVSGVLGHRKHFEKYVDAKTLELFGGLVDYCLWLDHEKKAHVITIRPEHTEIYSGYVWKCVAPKELVVNATPCLSDVFFLWDHVNFASKDALAYCLEALDRKEEHIRRRYGELLLVQKSSSLVAGQPIMAVDAVYDMLLGKSGIDI